MSNLGHIFRGKKVRLMGREIRYILFHNSEPQQRLRQVGQSPNVQLMYRCQIKKKKEKKY